MPNDVLNVQRASMASLYIEMYWDGNFLASGTGFVYEREGLYYLVTARHCLSGRHPDTNHHIGSWGVEPDEVYVYHRTGTDLGVALACPYPLVDEHLKPLYYEHPTYGRAVDVVALPIPKNDFFGGILFLPLVHPGHFSLTVAEDLSIVGYPFGFDENTRLPVWARGTIASEPEVPYSGKPVFLIDSRTRQGQSGSPVIRLYQRGEMVPRSSDNPDETLVMASYLEPITRLVGVYSGRVDEKSDLGFVWPLKVVDEICDGKVRNPYVT
ncbi:serine protease [Rhodococcus sp. C26F]